MSIALQTSKLSVGYTSRRKQPHRIATNLDLVLESGQLVCLLGANGTGKSTLIRTLAGMQAPIGGDIWLDGKLLRKLSANEIARQLAVVLTDRVEAGSLSAYGLAALGRYPYTDWSGKLTAHDEEIVQWAMQVTRSVELASRFVSELSDGERQRVMIARALAQEPQVIILDEPTAFLDYPRRVETMRLLRQLARDADKAILLSTHDLELALRHADRLWLFDSEGVITTGSPEEIVQSGALANAFQMDNLPFMGMLGDLERA